MNDNCALCFEPVPGTPTPVVRFDGIPQSVEKMFVVVHKDCLSKLKRNLAEFLDRELKEAFSGRSSEGREPGEGGEDRPGEAPVPVVPGQSE